MKTITIPTYNNPFVVVINNKVYQYKGGETIEVPDEVAEAIALQEKVRKEQSEAFHRSIAESKVLVLEFSGIGKSNLVAKDGVNLPFDAKFDYQTILEAAQKGTLSFVFVADGGTIAINPQIRTWANGLIEAHFMLLWNDTNAYWFTFNCNKDTGYFYRSNMYSVAVTKANP